MKALLSRRSFLSQAARSSVALATMPLLRQHGSAGGTGPATRIVPLDSGWLFGQKSGSATAAPEFDDAALERVSLPHCVVPLSWQDWDPASWEHVWLYRRHFHTPPDFRGLRVFLQLEGVMVGATPTVNGRQLATHLGGYLPFQYEITEILHDGDNFLAIAVDGRWSNVPPEGSSKGPSRIDYLEPSGIYRPVRLKAVPLIFISDVFAKPVDVLDSGRRVDVVCTVDAGEVPTGKVDVRVELRDGPKVLARAKEEVACNGIGETEVRLSLTRLANIRLWELQEPHLYSLVTTLFLDGRPLHDHHARFGFRDARFDLDGFFLNGRRLQIFGLNRHQYYPYAGGAMPARVQRKDALILRHDLNCNMVRCSHYPQSEAFLDACDELGLLAWEEVPGWGYLGDASWKDLLVRDVRDMIVRDRNHPSIVIWGVRVNESANDVELYRRTTTLAKSLDDSRPDSGSMTSGSRKTWRESWHEDVFAYDDYHSAPDGTVGISEPVEGVPYMISEAVGQFSYAAGHGFENIYRRAGDVEIQKQQAIWHAQAHSRAAANRGISGVIAWCAFEYGSLVNAFRAVKYPGVCDAFRIPKLGASFYLAQADPEQRPVIEPNFYWDFGPQTPQGPGRNVAIFSNCDRLELFIDGRKHATIRPDFDHYPEIQHPPCFTNLIFEAGERPELLRIDGYRGEMLALSRSFSSDRNRDRFECRADDRELIADGADATRLVCRVVDRFGSPRAFAAGSVHFTVEGPGKLCGDNPVDLAPAGGAAAVWILTRADAEGTIRITARHPLGVMTLAVGVRRRPA